MVDRTLEALATYKQMVAMRGRIEALRYVGDGKFDYDYDVFNMQPALEVIAESGRKPTAPMNMSPDHPNRDAMPPSRH